MSAIVGVLSFQNHDFIKNMLHKIEHRGTSDFHLWEVPHAILGAIAYEDIHEKPGPIATPSNKRSIVLDGWLINQQALSEQLALHNLEKTRFR